MANATPLNPHPRPTGLFIEREHWWHSEVPRYVGEACLENIDEEQARAILDARSRGDHAEVGRIVCRRIAPYLDKQCDEDLGE